MTDTGTSQKTIKWYDPTQGHVVDKIITVPPPAKVTNLPCGATVQEIDSMDDLKAMWGASVVSDLSAPLASHGRMTLQEELLKAITEPAEREAITTLCESHHFNDDRMLKLLGRLLAENGKQRQKRERSVQKREQLLHEKEILLQDKQRLQAETKALTADVSKLVGERDEALRLLKNVRGGDSAKVSQLEAALTQTITAKAEVERERDFLKREAQRNTEIALTEYETEVMGKLGTVAAEHKVAVEDRDEALRRNAKLEQEILAMKAKNENKKHQVQKECDMNPENENVARAADELRAGDEVYCKVSGEGPFVLMTVVDEAQVEYANPISSKKNSFAVGKLAVYNAWLVRCKDGTFRTLPAPALSRTVPKSSFSLGGVKSLVTSDVTAKVFQAAIWITMLTLLYTRS